MAGMIINNYPLLANGLILLASLLAGFFALIFAISVFSSDKSKGLDLVYLFITSIVFLMLILSGVVLDAIQGFMSEIATVISFRPGNLIGVFAIVSALSLMALIMSVITFFSEEKAKRARVVFSVAWVLSAYFIASTHRVTIEALTILNSPLILYWAYRYVQGKDHKSKYSSRKKTKICLSIFIPTFLLTVFFIYLDSQPLNSRLLKHQKNSPASFKIEGTPIDSSKKYNLDSPNFYR